MSVRDIPAALAQQQADLMRLMEQARSGAFIRGDEPKTHMQDYMNDQVARLQHALDDVESALEQIDEHARSQHS